MQSDFFKRVVQSKTMIRLHRLKWNLLYKKHGSVYFTFHNSFLQNQSELWIVGWRSTPEILYKLTPTPIEPPPVPPPTPRRTPPSPPSTLLPVSGDYHLLLINLSISSRPCHPPPSLKPAASGANAASPPHHHCRPPLPLSPSIVDPVNQKH